MWSALLPELASLGWHAIALDLPGHGMSDPPPSQPDVAYYARRIAQALDALNLRTVDVVGHHTGSAVAFWLANDFPDRVRRMVTYGVPLLDEALARQLRDEPSPVYGADGADVMFWWGLFTQAVPPEQASVLVPRYMGDMLMTGANRAYGHRAVARGREQFETILRTLRVPTLAVAGRREMLLESTRAAVKLSPSLRFHELEDAGIFAADECPRKFAEVIDQFLRQ
jgi:pimeloyl-ACP methyl ester carboxylesterase